jgi:hypothetical protein
MTTTAGIGRRLGLGLALAVALAGLPGTGMAQVARFDPDDYGQTDLSTNESTGDAASYVAANSGAFEPIRELPLDNPIRRTAEAVGRLDLLQEAPNGTRGLVTCTGAILPGGWVLTNHHCIPHEGEKRLLAASIMLGYLQQGDKDVARYRLSVDPSDWHAYLDFSLVRMIDVPVEVTPLQLAETWVDPGDALMVIHHPLGKPQVMTRFRCFAFREQDDGPILRHRCDTQPGSSGSILFDSALRAVALHHSGGMTPNDSASYNQSTRLSAILETSALLREIAGTAPVPGTGTAPQAAPAQAVESAPAPSDGGMSAGGITDLLRGN